MSGSRALRVTLVALWIGLWPGLALGQGEAARRFEEGTAAFERGDFAVAARAFDDAQTIAPAPAALYNAARAWSEAGDAPRAADRYANFLETAPADVAERPTAERELARLRRKLVTARIEGPAGARIRIAHVEDAALPLAVHLRPGAQVGTARSGDGPGQSVTVEGKAGESVRVTVVPPGPRDPTPPPPGDPALPPPVTPPPDEESGGGSSGMTVAGVTLIGLGAVGVGVGIGIGVQAVSARDEFVAGGNVDAELRAEADDLRTASNVTWAVGATVATVGVILLVTSLVDGDDDAVAAARRGPPRLAIRF